MRKLFFVSLALMSASYAQTAQSILDKLQAAQNNAKDVSARIVGKANSENGSQNIDIEIGIIPSLKLSRIFFNAPDALADNFIIVDNKTIYNYSYFTNQIVIQKAGKQDMQGFSFDFSQFTNIGSELDSGKFDVKLLSSDKANQTHWLEATPKDDSSGFGKTRLQVTENGWRPLKMQSLDAKDKVIADLSFTTWKINSGLTAKKLKSYPKDAQVIKK